MWNVLPYPFYLLFVEEGECVTKVDRRGHYTTLSISMLWCTLSGWWERGISCHDSICRWRNEDVSHAWGPGWAPPRPRHGHQPATGPGERFPHFCEKTTSLDVNSGTSECWRWLGLARRHNQNCLLCVTFRASNEDPRRFHNHRIGLLVVESTATFKTQRRLNI